MDSKLAGVKVKEKSTRRKTVKLGEVLADPLVDVKNIDAVLKGSKGRKGAEVEDPPVGLKNTAGLLERSIGKKGAKLEDLPGEIKQTEAPLKGSKGGKGARLDDPPTEEIKTDTLVLKGKRGVKGSKLETFNESNKEPMPMKTTKNKGKGVAVKSTRKTIASPIIDNEDYNSGPEEVNVSEGVDGLRNSSRLSESAASPAVEVASEPASEDDGKRSKSKKKERHVSGEGRLGRTGIKKTADVADVSSASINYESSGTDRSRSRLRESKSGGVSEVCKPYGYIHTQ